MHSSAPKKKVNIKHNASPPLPESIFPDQEPRVAASVRDSWMSRVVLDRPRPDPCGREARNNHRAEDRPAQPAIGAISLEPCSLLITSCS